MNSFRKHFSVTTRVSMGKLKILLHCKFYFETYFHQITPTPSQSVIMRLCIVILDVFIYSFLRVSHRGSSKLR